MEVFIDFKPALLSISMDLMKVVLQFASFHLAETLKLPVRRAAELNLSAAGAKTALRPRFAVLRLE